VAAVAADDLAEFDAELERARAAEARVAPGGARVAWAPQPGSQVDFLSCPIFEVLYSGTRGGGKTDALLMSFAQHVGRGHGSAWRGVLFRQTYPQLADVVAKSEKWFRRIFPGARFNRGRMLWEWESGEVLLFRHLARPDDYYAHHGHEYPWIGFEELANWASDECYRRMFSCCRSSTPGVPRMIRSTTNPYGPGMSWIKERFGLAGRWWKTVVLDRPVDSRGRPEPPRAAIHSHLSENRILLEADPEYPSTIAAAATSDAMAEAWLDGSWDIVAGGMFDDVWDARRNLVGEFDVPPDWRVDRCFDWGSSAPFAAYWVARSDGSDLRMRDGSVLSTVPGDLFVVREWYGWTGRPNEGLRMLAVDVARGIVEREVAWGWRTERGSRVRPGPADSSIWTVENGQSIAADMDRPVRIDGRVYQGVSWTSADKRPGSRNRGWEMLRKMIRAARPVDGSPTRERPGLFVVGDRCPQLLRTLLVAPRDSKDMDDVPSSYEDHALDAIRYRVLSVGGEVRGGSTTGLY